MKTLITLLLTMSLIIPVTSFSQWSSDPMQNTPVDTSLFDQTNPKIAIDQETGNIFIAYLSLASGNYDLMMQYFNHQGYILWPEPLVVSNNTQELGPSDFSAMTDHDGNCVIAFSDIRNGTPDAYAYKVSPEGQQLWGEQGIRLSHHPEAEYNPVLCITADNNAIVSWTEMNVNTGDNLVMSAIDQNGNLLWNMGSVIWIPDGDYSYASPSLVSTNDGDFIVIFRRSSGPNWATTRYVYAQRINISGEPVWPAEVHINDAGGLTAWDKLSIKADNDGGFYVAWDDDRDLDAVRESFVQHVDASGNLLFISNGLLVSTEFAQRTYPVVAGWNDNNEIFVYWRNVSINKADEDALFGQRISQDGNRMWTDKGKKIIPPNNGLNRILGCDVRNNLSYLFYVVNGTEDDVLDQRIRAKCLDKEGNSGWEIDQLSVSETRKEIPISFVSDYSEGQWIIAWLNVRDTIIGDLYAQNINDDGSLGNTTGLKEYVQPEINVYPNPCHETLNICQKGYQRLYLINLAGHVVLEKIIHPGDNSVNVSELNPGVYILKFSGQKGIAVGRMEVVSR